MADHLLIRHAAHAARRADEMREAAEALAELGTRPIVTEAAAERIAESVRLGSPSSSEDDSHPRIRPSWRHLVGSVSKKCLRCSHQAHGEDAPHHQPPGEQLGEHRAGVTRRRESFGRRTTSC